MRRVDTGDPEVLTYRGGGGGAILVGIILILFGIGIVAVSIGTQKGSVIPGFIIAVIGLVLLLHRRGMEIDGRSRQWRRWWGLPSPMRTREGSVDDFDKVSISCEVRQVKHQKYFIYPVRLEGKKRFSFGSPRSYDTSRREGEDLARALHLPLADRTSGTEVVRDPEHLDESLKDRVLRGAESITLPAQPESLVSRFETDGKTLRFEIPRARFSFRYLPMLIPLVAFEFIILVTFLIPLLMGNNPWGEGGARIVAVTTIFVLAAMVPLVVLVVILGRRKPSTVEASPQWLRIHTGPEGRQTTVELPAETIEEIEIRQVAPGDRGVVGFLDGGAPITVRSDEKTVTFGGHLPPDEKRWMVQVLKQVLTA